MRGGSGLWLAVGLDPVSLRDRAPPRGERSRATESWGRCDDDGRRGLIDIARRSDSRAGRRSSPPPVDGRASGGSGRSPTPPSASPASSRERFDEGPLSSARWEHPDPRRSRSRYRATGPHDRPGGSRYAEPGQAADGSRHPGHRLRPQRVEGPAPAAGPRSWCVRRARARAGGGSRCGRDLQRDPGPQR